ncbi:GntR family transcriptional regulator [Streptomyces anulatus]|uniref:GntR family transcriptional regulator n=1 Tax=Streptomyces anulatus TaxID=1892 RepID=UPI00342C72F1
MSQQVSPRGTFLKIADAVKAQINADETMVELPTAADLMSDFGVSRGVALRAFSALHKEGVAEPVPGGRWRAVRPGKNVDRRPLAERLTDVITNDQLPVGATFPSATKLCARFGVSRPTVAKALDKLEAAGLLSEGKQGKPRTVLSLPKREESAGP